MCRFIYFRYCSILFVICYQIINFVFLVVMLELSFRSSCWVSYSPHFLIFDDIIYLNVRMLNTVIMLKLTNNVFHKIYTFNFLLFVLFLLVILILLFTFNLINPTIVHINFKYFLITSILIFCTHFSYLY